MRLQLSTILKGAESYLASNPEPKAAKVLEVVSLSVEDCDGTRHRVLFQLFAQGVSASKSMGLWQAFQRHVILNYERWGLSEEDCRELLFVITSYHADRVRKRS
jgi:hypothetical protein